MTEREKWLACDQCGHLNICHRERCKGLVEGENDDVVECDCVEFVHPPKAEH